MVLKRIILLQTVAVAVPAVRVTKPLPLPQIELGTGPFVRALLAPGIMTQS